MGSSNVWAALRPLSSAHTTALRGCSKKNPRTQLRLLSGLVLTREVILADEEIDRGNVESDNDTDLRYGDRLGRQPTSH